MITAPFNFVPLSEEVFFPDWAQDVSHDVPFEDSQSGVIDITLTAKSPIFIRDSKDETKFCHHQGEHYIPSTSVKGMIRSIVEILSFSKIETGSFNDTTYSVRDLSDSNNFYMREMKKDTFCGWMRKDGNDYIVEDCEKPGRIKHEEIDAIFGVDFASKFKKGTFPNKADSKTALKKYAMIKSDTFTYPFKHTATSTTGDKRYSLDKTSTLMGTVVFTGQPSGRDESRKIPSGKVYEFIFFEKKEDIVLEKKVVENFLFAYFDERETQPKESPDWTEWKKKLNDGEKVPVFFQKSGKKIKHFGLSYLYKLPYAYSVKDGIPETHTDDRYDLTQTVFGYVKGKKALKGRVQFSHFKATSNVQELASTTEILGTPRASYFPIYVQQKDGNLYSTFMDANFALAGRKRYPIHASSKTVKTTDTGNENVGTKFSPLKDGVVFKGKLKYHNLKKSELGAVLSALTFHNTQGCFHNIGMAKALGYGKVKLTIDNLPNIREYLKEFEVQMSQNVQGWASSQELKELLSMATEQKNQGDSKLQYMELKEFANNKRNDNKNYLKNYTQLSSIETKEINALVSKEELEGIEKENELRLVQEKEQKVFRDELSIIEKSDNIQSIENFINKYPEYENIAELITKKEALQKAQESNKFQKVDADAKAAWDELQKKKSNPKQYGKLRDKFIKKWEAKKNNKGSEFVLELVKNL